LPFKHTFSSRREGENEVLNFQLGCEKGWVGEEKNKKGNQNKKYNQMKHP